MAPHTRRFEVDDPNDTSVHLPKDVAYETILMVNVVYFGDPNAENRQWVLIDAGMPGFAGRIAQTARQRFGDVPPRAIILTHGHFDHIGSLRALLDMWPDVPVYAHTLEHPYLTNRDKYPPPDTSVHGMMARTSFMFPRSADFSDRLLHLPDDGSIPYMPGWRWIHTPGHAPGHVSLYREEDGTLIAGDAFVTQVQETLSGVVTRKRVMHGPPMYFTPDWDAARVSVQKLADLHPHLAITGHGYAMANPLLDHELDELARNFDEIAIPKGGRYAEEPAVMNEDGVVSVPPKPFDPVPALALIASMVAVGVGVSLLVNRSQKEPEVETVHDWLKGRMDNLESKLAAAVKAGSGLGAAKLASRWLS